MAVCGSKCVCDASLPRKAQDWKIGHLENLGVFYERKSSPIEHIFSNLKGQVGRKSRTNVNIAQDLQESLPLPEVILKIIAFVNKIWTFSFDVDKCGYGAEYRHVQNQLAKLKREISVHENEFRLEHDHLLRDSQNFRIFNDWCTMMRRFLSWWDVFLTILRNEETRGGSFTQLYMQFFGICLLVPEIGETFKSSMTLNGIKVSGIPNVRFSRFTMHGCCETVGFVTQKEVEDTGFVGKGCKDLCDNSFAIHKSVSSDLLGQHGAELLLETNRSFFRPKTSGMICVASKIIFTFLDIDLEHLRAIKENEMCKTEKQYRSTIYYSRPYDFMDFLDRTEMLEMLFWLSLVQSSEYELYKS